MRDELSGLSVAILGSVGPPGIPCARTIDPPGIVDLQPARVPLRLVRFPTPEVDHSQQYRLGNGVRWELKFLSFVQSRSDKIQMTPSPIPTPRAITV